MRWVYARTGRGAVVLFDVYPLIDAQAAKQFLKRQAGVKPSGRKR